MSPENWKELLITLAAISICAFLVDIFISTMMDNWDEGDRDDE